MQKSGLCLLAVWFCCLGVGSEALAQDEPVTPRKLAPNVLKIVAPSLMESEAVSNVQPLYDLATTPYQPETRPLSDTLSSRAAAVVLRRDIWGVEIAFKPLRMIEAEVPQPSGKMQKKTVFYLMFRVRFNGEVLGSISQVDLSGRETFEVRTKDIAESSLQEIRLFPSFALQTSIIDPISGAPIRKEYLDRVMPHVVQQIQADEDPAIRLLNTVELAAEPIYRQGDDDFAVGRDVWGVATWEDVDPRADYLTVQIEGLTNAFRVEQTVDGKQFEFKTLQLNFYRPGDAIDEVDDKVAYGIPLVDDVEEQIDICRLYQLPGPQLVAYEVDPNNDRSDRLMSIATNQNKKLDTLEALALDSGTLPGNLADGLTRLGYDLAGATPETKIRGSRWEIQTTRLGKSALVRIELEPQLWQKVGTHFEFKDRLEYFWLYR